MRAILFDLDGTLLDTLGDLHAAVNRTLARYELPARTLMEVRGFVGNGVEKLMERAIPQGKADPRFEEMLSDFKQDYAAHATDHTAPYAGIPALLRALKDGGYRVGVVSNKFDAATKALCGQFFGPLVDVAVGENERGGVRKKPAPDTVFNALRLLDADEGLYVGDSEVDIETAKNAHLPCVSVTWGFRSREELVASGATHLIDTPQQLTQWLKEQC